MGERPGTSRQTSGRGRTETWRGGRGVGAGVLRLVVLWALGVLCGVVWCAGPVWADGVSRGGFTVHTFATAGEFSEAASPYQVIATNSGSVPLHEPMMVKVTLPAGFTATENEFSLLPAVRNGQINQISPEPIGVCQQETGGQGEAIFMCPVETESGLLEPNEAVEVVLSVAAEAGTPSGRLSSIIAAAPGAPEASVQEPLRVGSASFSFGASAFTQYIAGASGEVDQQAGGHPSQMTTRIDLNNVFRTLPTGQSAGLTSVHDVRDVIVDLPVGVIGDAQATPKCTFAELGTFKHCRPETRVGQITSEPRGNTAVDGPLYNMVPEYGVAAEFGFFDGLKSTHAIYADVAPTPSGYVVRATTREVPQVPLTSASATIFGDPATSDSTEIRGQHLAMLTNPSDCSGQPSVSTLHLDSWQEPGAFGSNGTPQGEPEVNGANWVSAGSDQWPAGGTVTPATTASVIGCNRLSFVPSGFTVQPESTSTDSATGLTVDEQLPQDEHFNTLATPPLRDETVTLPPGLVPNPASASGLQGCSEAQIGWLGGTLSNFTPAAPACPDASKIASVKVITPVLENPVVGTMYLANQNENPFNSNLAAYIVIDDPTTGIIIKVPGKLELNPATGQVTGSFTEAPQLGAFSDLELHFFGGARGKLATPESCGTYTTTGQLTPWSAPESGPAANVAANFTLNSGCVPEFAPTFAAATSSPQAGGYSPLTLAFSRQDNEQEISGLTVTLPPGLTAKLAGVAKCPETALAAAKTRSSGAAEIASPSCPAASEIGTVQASAGAGTDPLVLGGKAYLTGPYNNAPLGLAVIIPAVAGPFDLGNVVVRTALHIDPNDAHVTAISDALPTIVDATGHNGQTDGFPVRMRSVTVNLNRNTYVLNPTNCNVAAINAAFTSTSGLTSAGSSRFQAGGCRELPFKPGFAAGTQGHASKANGTSLKVHVTSSFGQANIAKVKVTLPKQLPSRLTTLQKACLASVFEANPAACPEGSVVGTATAHTPLLEQPFTGPAYLVSHGGAAFPDLEYVLESEHILLILDGKTDIKKGITTSSFNTVPDAPVSSFETTFPAGPHSILGTYLPAKDNYNLCGQTLTMPTIITGQNGTIAKQTTKITINNCPKPNKKHKTNKHNTKHPTKKH